MTNLTALIIEGMQNDTCHEDGAYNKHGLKAEASKKIIANIAKVIDFCKNLQIPTLATKLTVLKDLNKQAIGLGSFKNLRPFLEKEGFRENTWGHNLIEKLPKVDYSIRKWNLSSFFQTELEKYLQALKCEEIVIVGFTTNGPVETLAREAWGRNYKITTLTDCVASYSDELHRASLTNLGSFGKIITSSEWTKQFEEII